MNKENKLILYRDDEGRVNVNMRFADKELEQDAVVRKFRTTNADDNKHQILHHIPDVIIARHHFSLVKMRIIEN
ncbi:MAG: hypothetical protein IIZ94_07820 [Prevotella sp.]|nr:hypothetical protein [Prevotella sp.]